jgi:hypothetical protein
VKTHLHGTVVVLGQGDAREEVGENGLKENRVVRKKLREIRIAQSREKNLRFWLSDSASL